MSSISHPGILAFLCAAFAAAPLSALDTPSVVSATVIHTEPYVHTGLVYTPANNDMLAIGSGYLVHNNVVLTDAHVIFDESTLSWRTGTGFQRIHHSNIGYLNGRPIAGSIHLSSYSEALQEFMKDPDYQSGKQNGTTFNSDFTALYSLSSFFPTYGNYVVSRNGESSLFCEAWQSLLLGYPADPTYISETDAGFMHQTGGGGSNWRGIDVFGENRGDAYVGSVHAALYVYEDEMTSYRGNSGGPILLYDEDDGRYVDAGTYLGGIISDESTTALFRIIDETAENMIEQAITASGSTHNLSPVAFLSAGGSDSSIILNWTDTAEGETGWEIRRNNGNAWTIVGTAPANATTYTDTTAEKGITYQYAIRAIQTTDTLTNRGPWSARSAACTSGANTNLALARGLGAQYLCVTSGGDAPFFAAPDASYVRSGRILNQQTSHLTITVTGPGTLSYEVATSTESAQTDKLLVALDGSTQTTIGGSTSYALKSINIASSGSHTVTFTYVKDYYTKDLDDCIYLRNVSFVPSGTTEAIPGSKITSGNWRYSPWAGHYFDYGNHWIYSYNLGYVYVFPVTKSGWTAEKSLWLYFAQGNTTYDAIGWCWIGMDMLPDMWSCEVGWLYYYMDSNWMQEYSDGSYIKL
jgi:hypothetical protein